jgi:hypothetical protein
MRSNPAAEDLRAPEFFAPEDFDEKRARGDSLAPLITRKNFGDLALLKVQRQQGR